MEGKVGLPEGRGQGWLGGRNTLVVMDGARGFGDDLRVGMLKEFGQQGGFLAGEGQRREDGVGTGTRLRHREELRGILRAGQAAYETVAEPGHPQVSFGIAEESVEGNLAAEFAERDAGLGADTRVGLA